MMLPLIALVAIVAILIASAVARFPIWNPIYFFGGLFALQIGAGFFFVQRLGMEAPPAFSLPLLGAYLLTLGLLLAYSLRDREIVAGTRDLSERFAKAEITPWTVRILTLLLALVALHNTVVNLIVMARWKTLPVLAFNTYRRDFAAATPGVTLPQDVGSAFSVPFFSVVADHLVNPAVVIYLVLLLVPKLSAPGDRSVGPRSIPWWVHALFGIVVLNASIVHRRSPLLLGIATAVLLLYVLRRLPRRLVFAAGVALLVGAVAFGQWRRGRAELRAAEELSLPAVAGNTMVYEPLVYVGSGVPNFLRYWSEDHPAAGGDLLLSSLFPRPIDEALGLDVNRTVMLRRMFDDGFLIPGQTFRTPWFEAFFDFGWAGVYLVVLFFSTGTYWLYRRTLVGAGGGAPSVAFFTLAKIIYLFPFLTLLFQLPFWVTAGMALLIDGGLMASASPARKGHPFPARP